VPLKIVIDTNVLVSAILKRGSPSDALLRHWLAGDFLLVTCPAALAELADVLDRSKIHDKYRLADEDVTEFLRRFQLQAESVYWEHLSLVSSPLTQRMTCSSPVQLRGRPAISLVATVIF